MDDSNEPANLRQDELEKDDDKGPGSLYDVYSQNELVSERLKLLNYETDFVLLEDSFKTIPRHYFVQSKNVGEQFHLFTSICAWLIRKSGIADMEMPHEFDDPNETIARILDAIRSKGIDVNFPPNKLKSGAGPQCLYILLHLTGIALEQSGFQFGVIQPVEEPSTEEDTSSEQHLQQSELTADQFDEEVEFAEDEDEPLAEATDLGMDSNGLLDVDVNEKIKGIMSSNAIDSHKMQHELKRVIPQLKITIRANQKDWRMHIEQMQKLETIMNQQYAEMTPILKKTSDEIEQAMEKIHTREQHLNDQFVSLLQLDRSKQNELAAISEQYKENSGLLNSRTEELNTLNGEIEQLKQQIEEQGTQNTSGAPILKIKQALLKMDKDCYVMRVQIATLEQALMQTQLANRLDDNNAIDFLNYTN